MTSARPPWSPAGDGVRIAVRVTTRAGRNRLDGTVELADGNRALAVRLGAPPVNGAANKALIAMLAERLGISRSAIAIISGVTSRNKIVQVTGVTAELVSHRLESGSA
jgi:uncharacterized protein